MISFDRCRAVLNELGPIFQHSFGLNKLLKKEVSRDSKNMNFCLVLRSSSITLKSFRPSLISSSSCSTPNARATSATENSRRDSTRTSGMVYLRYIPTSWFSIVNITEYGKTYHHDPLSMYKPTDPLLPDPTGAFLSALERSASDATATSDQVTPRVFAAIMRPK